MGQRSPAFVALLAVGLIASGVRAGDAPGDLELAHKAILETIEECKQIEDEVSRESAMSELAWALADIGRVDEALELAKAYPGQCLWVLRHIANVLAQGGRLDEAARITDMLQYPHWKCAVLVDLAAAYVEAGENGRAASCLERAMPLAEKQGDSTALAKIGLLYAALGERERAKHAFARAVQLKREEFPSSKPDLWNDTVYEFQARAGFVDEAIKNAAAAKDQHAIRRIAMWQAYAGQFDAAKATALECDMSARIHALGAIACFQIIAGKRDDGFATLEGALGLVSGTPQKAGLPYMQKVAAVIYAASGETARAVALVERIWDEAPAGRMSIEAGTEVGAKLAGTDRAAALRLLNRARTDAQTLTSLETRLQMLHSIGWAYGEAGEPDTAKQILLDAIEQARKDAKGGGWYLQMVATLARVGATDDAKKLFAQALEQARADGASLYAIGNDLLSAGFFDDAARVAIETRTSLVYTVAWRHAEAEGAGPALAWISRMEDPVRRAVALHGLTRGLTEHDSLLGEDRLNLRRKIDEQLSPYGL